MSDLYTVRESVDNEDFKVWHIYAPNGSYVAEAQNKKMAEEIVRLANPSERSAMSEIPMFSDPIRQGLPPDKCFVCKHVRHEGRCQTDQFCVCVFVSGYEGQNQ